MFIFIKFINFVIICLIANENLSNCSNYNNQTFTFQIKKSKDKLHIINTKYRSLSITNTSIFGNTSQFYYYYIDILIGNPPRKQSFITDTGSTLMATPCGDICDHCGNHINSYYEIKSKSKTII